MRLLSLAHTDVGNVASAANSGEPTEPTLTDCRHESGKPDL